VHRYTVSRELRRLRGRLEEAGEGIEHLQEGTLRVEVAVGLAVGEASGDEDLSALEDRRGVEYPRGRGREGLETADEAAPDLLVTDRVGVDGGQGIAETFDRYLLCTLGGGTGATCAVSSSDEPLVAPRAGHADLCLIPDSDGPGCQEYMLLGGAVGGGASGEVFSSSEDVFNAALEFVDPDKTGLIGALLSEMVRVEGDGEVPDIFSFGGTTAVGNHELLDDEFRVRIYPPIHGPAPEQVRVDLQSGNLTVAQVDLSDLGGDDSKTFRIFHSSTVLDDGSVLVAGGLDAETRASKNVMFFEDPNTDALTFSGEANMRQRRFGHTATVIPAGLLKGAVLFVGGFTADADTGLVDFSPSAEIFLPAQ